MYLATTRWPDGRVCPHCGGLKSYAFNNGKLSSALNVKSSSAPKLALSSLIVMSPYKTGSWPSTYLPQETGISSIRLAEYIEVTQKTAWFMLHRIRYAMKHGTFDKPTDDVVEMDETYASGKTMGKRGCGAGNKVPVFDIVERGGSISAVATPDVSAKSV